MPAKFNSYDTTFLIQQIWGCLADCIGFSRYSSLTNSNDTNSKQFLTPAEIERFQEELYSKFRRDLDVDIKKSLKRNVNYIRKQIQKGG